jgi:hypothetical protein
MMTRIELHGSICRDLNDRSTWETRQRLFYEMRHNGLRRKSKPFPGAADLHFPLSDTIVGKLKPYYAEQLFATDTLATFVCKRAQDSALTSAAAKWFDYQTKQRTNLEVEILSTIDWMLMSGRSVLKVYWDAEQKRVAYDAVDPMRIILPRHTVNLATADRLVHVMPMSVEAYRRNTLYNQDPEFIKKITGKGVIGEKHDKAGLSLIKASREGITFGSTSDEIIIWEVFSRTESGKWQVETFSPLEPEEDVRKKIGFPYNHGLLPFVDFFYEVKDKGWFSSRGVVEQVAPFESSLCKLWNEKHDAMTFYNRPLFRSSTQIPNAANLEFRPGQILPYDIQPVHHGQPPMSFDQEMLSTRQVAEQRMAVPDYGMNQVLNASDRRTAREIGEISQMSANVTDLRMRIFRRSLGAVYQQSWELHLQYNKQDLVFCIGEELGQVDEKALHGDYQITPTGSADGVNKAFNMQKAVQRFQMFRDDPFINQGELRKTILESDDVALTRRLFVDPMLTQATQQEDQAQEISILNIGFPARVLPSDDHQLHIETLIQYLESRQALGEPVNPMAQQRIMEHIGKHLEALDQENPKLARQIRKVLMTMAQSQEQQQPPAPQLMEAGV